MNMRIIVDSIIVMSALFAPWYITLVIVAFALVLCPAWEIVLWMFCIDLISHGAYLGIGSIPLMTIAAGVLYMLLAPVRNNVW